MLNFSSHLNIPEEILSRGNKHRERYRASEHDIDFNGVVRPSILLRYMQETNFLQHVNNPPTLAELRKEVEKFLFVMKKDPLRKSLAPAAPKAKSNPDEKISAA